MSTPNPYSKHSSEIESVLNSARFRPDAVFEERLHARLSEMIPEPPRRSRWAALREIVFRGERDAQQPRRLREPRWIAAFSVLVLGLMAYLFIRLVLIQPTSFGTMATETPVMTQEALPMGIIFGEEIELTESRVEQNGDTWTIYLWWRAIQPPSKDYTIAIFAGNSSEILGQVDAPLTGGDLLSSNSADWNLPPTRWLVDRPIASSYTMVLPVGTSPEGFAVEVRDPETGVQLHLEKDGYSLSTIKAYIWDAAAATQTAEPTPVATETPASLANPFPVRGNPVTLSLSGDGKVVAVEMGSSAEAWPQIYAINVSSGQATYIADGAWPSLNADGSRVAFVIRPRTDFAPGWNRMNIVNTALTDASTYVDVSSIGPLFGQIATMPDISGDGAAVTFLADPTEVEGMPSNPLGFDVFVYENGVLERIAPTEYGDAEYITSQPSISADGRYVAFAAAPTNLDLELPNGVFVWDQTEEQLTFIGDGIFPEISPDGSAVAYVRFFGEPGEGEGWINAYATNWKTGETRWLGSMLDASPDGGWIERVFSLSAGGSRIAFWSVLEGPRDPKGLPPSGEGLGSAYGNRYLFVYDWASDTLERAELDAPHPLGFVYSPAISADGNIVAYLWRSVTDDASGIFIRDLVSDQTVPVRIGE